MAEIAEACGFQRFLIRHHADGSSIGAKVRKRLGFYRDWQRALRSMQDGSMLLLQFPFQDLYYFYPRYLEKAKKRGIRLVYLVHDVERLRGNYNSPRHEKELEFLRRNADAVIVHDPVMREYFVRELGMEPGKVITLGIFDYLCEEQTEREPESADIRNEDKDSAGGNKFRNKIYIAGNLDTEKTGYLKHLPEIRGLQFELYGVKCPEFLKQAENIHYNGVAEPEKLPDLLKGGFGLVWDGDSPDTCSGFFGEYLRYNSPHKLSLYLAAGIPVVIWEEAAQAAFVKENGVGITVSSLREAAGKIAAAEGQYGEMAESARKLAVQLREGYYTRLALKRAEEICES